MSFSSIRANEKIKSYSRTNREKIAWDSSDLKQYYSNNYSKKEKKIEKPISKIIPDFMLDKWEEMKLFKEN